MYSVKFINKLRHALRIVERRYWILRQYLLRSKFTSVSLGARQRQPDIWRDRIDGFALRAPIGVIDTVALVMAMQQSSEYEVRYRPAVIRPSGSKDPCLNLLILLLSEIVRISRAVSLCRQLRPDRCNHGSTATVAIGQRCRCLAEPVAYRNLLGFASDIRSETATLSCRLCD
jgi:hypothetical protein